MECSARDGQYQLLGTCVTIQGHRGPSGGTCLVQTWPRCPAAVAGPRAAFLITRIRTSLHGGECQ